VTTGAHQQQVDVVAIDIVGDYRFRFAGDDLTDGSETSGLGRDVSLLQRCDRSVSTKQVEGLSIP